VTTPALRVLADDLTGACDMAAALLPWPDDVFVEAYEGGGPLPARGLRVSNTQSRTLPAGAARAAVARAVAMMERRPDEIVVKKIDTALRGHLGAELDTLMTVIGAEEGFVLPAIPEVGRTTVGGIQRIEGVPVHETVFANDPLHPIDDARVGVHLEREGGRRSRTLALADVRVREALVTAITDGRRAGCGVFVCDAEVDADLDRALDVLLERPRPLVLAGSLGVGRALRRRLVPNGGGRPRDAVRKHTAGILVVIGSLHPMARAQADAVAEPEAVHEVGAGGRATDVVPPLAARLARGEIAVLRTPVETVPATASVLLAAVGALVCACVAACPPGALVLVGGETAHAVLAAVRQPWIRVIRELGPLIVGGELVGGALAGTPIVTKGGSSGDAASLRQAVAWLEGGTR
jgi:uncharacterized protein YgbK (DUF1537 family)